MNGILELDNKIKKIYDSTDDSISEILNLLLSKSNKYNRIGSYFSSKSFIPLAEGLQEFLMNEGKIKLIINYELSMEDYDSVKKCISIDKASKNFEINLENLKTEIEKNSAKVLGWLISEGKLEIKVVTNKDRSLMHIKQGIIEDKYLNKVAFTGSMNETFSGYNKNMEQMAFFKNWVGGEDEYVTELSKKFNIFWTEIDKNFDTYKLFEAINNGLIKIRPKTKKEQDEVLTFLKNKIKKDMPRPYQEKAIKNWFNSNSKGIIEMPTGCGKTKTAIFCHNKLISNEKLISCIFSPTKTISEQWVKEFKKNNVVVCKIFNNYRWKIDLEKNLLNLKMGVIKRLAIIGTYTLMNSDYLISKIRSIRSIKKLLIADEVHSSGSQKNSEGLIEDYDFRLGLSATPKRWLDEYGTNKIMNYFGGVVFDEINLFDAIYKIKSLCEYEYNLIHVMLDTEKSIEYSNITKKIRRLYSMKNIEKNLNLENNIQRLLEKRSNIIKNCGSKLEILPEILKKEKNTKMIIFVSPDQRKIVNKIVLKSGIKFCQYTYGENSKERLDILEDFEKSRITCIVAIKCLDEGLDIPSVECGIIMASTGNPREFIQRRGRILRRDKNKNYAKLYDFFVTPKKIDLKKSDDFISQIKKEFDRIQEFSSSAKNEIEVSKELKTIRNKLEI